MLTLSKLARLANVSVSTASKAFSGSTEVNEETREMIFGIARQYGCFKKFYNAKYPKLVIAIIAPELRGVCYPRYLSCIQDNLERENCELCFSTTNFSGEKEKALVEYYYRHSNVDGIIVINPQSDLDGHYEIPVVFVNPLCRSAYAFSVESDLGPALQESAAYLRKKGVDSVGFIGEALTERKQQLFERVMRETGIALDERLVVVTERRFEEGGYRAMEQLFSGKHLPRAIVCAYDNMAVGAIRCIFDHGLRVPEDIAVLGMDDNFEAAYLNPPLASLSSDTGELCRIAAEAILNQSGQAAAQHVIASSFKLRRSFEIL